MGGLYLGLYRTVPHYTPLFPAARGSGTFQNDACEMKTFNFKVGLGAASEAEL